MDNQPYNPLHGVTLKTIVTELEAYFGFDELGKQIKINCFRVGGGDLICVYIGVIAKQKI